MNQILEISKGLKGEYKVGEQRIMRTPTGTTKEQLHSFSMDYLDTEIVLFGNYYSGSHLGKFHETPPYLIKIKTTSKSTLKIYPKTKIWRTLSRLFNSSDDKIESYYHFSSDKISKRLKRNTKATRIIMERPVSILTRDDRNEIEILIHERHLNKEQLLDLIDLSKELINELKKASS